MRHISQKQDFNILDMPERMRRCDSIIINSCDLSSMSTSMNLFASCVRYSSKSSQSGLQTARYTTLARTGSRTPMIEAVK